MVQLRKQQGNVRILNQQMLKRKLEKLKQVMDIEEVNKLNLLQDEVEKFVHQSKSLDIKTGN